MNKRQERTKGEMKEAGQQRKRKNTRKERKQEGKHGRSEGKNEGMKMQVMIDPRKLGGKSERKG